MLGNLRWLLRNQFWDAGDGFSRFGRSRYESRALWMPHLIGLVLNVGGGVAFMVSAVVFGHGFLRPGWVFWTAFLVQLVGLAFIFVPIARVERRQKALILANGRRVCPDCLHGLAGLDEIGVCPECRFPYRLRGLAANWKRRYPKLEFDGARGGVENG